MIDSPNTVLWSPDFRARLEGPAGGVLTQAQWEIYNHRREYLVPVFNRGQVLEFHYACTRPGDDLLPHVFVEAPVKGVKLLYRQKTRLVLGFPGPHRQPPAEEGAAGAAQAAWASHEPGAPRGPPAVAIGRAPEGGCDSLRIKWIPPIRELYT